MIITATRGRRTVHLLVPAVLTLLVAGCGGNEGDAALFLPEQIHGLPLIESQSGGDAAQAIGSLHEESVAPTESYIGTYGPEDLRMVLYVSRFGSADDARAQLAAMSERIGSGSSGYGHHTEYHIGGIEVHAVFGQGQIHYFYARDADLTWLATPPMLSRPVLGELLGIAVDSIPRFGVPTTGQATDVETG